MSDSATLFPGRLAACYEAFVAAVEAEGGASEEFKKTQVIGLARKFTWLTPLSKSKCLLLLDMYEKQTDPLFRDIIEYRADKFTHQIELDSPDLIRQASAAGWFRLAYRMGREDSIVSAGPSTFSAVSTGTTMVFRRAFGYRHIDIGVILTACNERQDQRRPRGESIVTMSGRSWLVASRGPGRKPRYVLWTGLLASLMGGVFAGLCILFVSLDIISRRLTHTSWLGYLLLCGGILQVLSGAASAIWFYRHRVRSDKL